MSNFFHNREEILPVVRVNLKYYNDTFSNRFWYATSFYLPIQCHKHMYVTYIHNWSLHVFNRAYDLNSHNTYVMSVNFIHECRDPQIEGHSKWQIFQKLFHGKIIVFSEFYLCWEEVNEEITRCDSENTPKHLYSLSYSLGWVKLKYVFLFYPKPPNLLYLIKTVFFLLVSQKIIDYSNMFEPSWKIQRSIFTTVFIKVLFKLIFYEFWWG